MRIKRHFVTRLLATAGLAAGGIGLMSGVASAHITPLYPEGPSGGYFTTAFKVGHGCGEEPTTKIEIKIPDGVTSVAPQPVPGWELSTTTRKLDPPIDMEGTKLTETTDTVVWQGGSLPHDQLQMFWLSMKLPEGKAGQQVAFPIIQTCGTTSTDWIAIPKEGEPEPDHPAAVVTLTAATEDHHGSSTTVKGSDEPAANGEMAASKSSQDDDSDSGNKVVGFVALGLAAVGVALGAAALAKSSQKGASA